MNQTPKFKEKETPGLHALLSEIQQLSRSGDKNERYQLLFEQMSEIMFVDFWSVCQTLVCVCQTLVCRLNTNSYYVSINEVEDILLEVLTKVFQYVETYSGKNDLQTKNGFVQYSVIRFRTAPE